MTDRPAKAEGMQWINAYLTVKNIDQALKFYNDAFGLETRMTLPDKEGNIRHAELGYKDAVLMIGPECPEDGTKSPSTLKGTPAGLYVYVDDIDGFYERAKAAGARVKHEPETMFWGDRLCSFECPEGHNWTFAQNVADFDPAKVPQG